MEACMCTDRPAISAAANVHWDRQQHRSLSSIMVLHEHLCTGYVKVSWCCMSISVQAM